MASPKKAASKKPSAKKAAAGVKTKKGAVAKKTAAKKATVATSAIKKGSRLACHVCGFAVTVDNVCGCMEEAQLICCEMPMVQKRPAAKKK